MIVATGGALRPAEWRDRLGALEAVGVTAIANQPAGEIPGGIEAFAA
jgi:hypothetical protein